MFPNVMTTVKRIWRSILVTVGIVLLGTAIGWNLLVAIPPYKPGDALLVQQQFQHERQCDSVGRTAPLGGGTGRLAYEAPDQKGHQTYIICANGTGRATLPTEVGNSPIQPEWSPDGKALLTHGFTIVLTNIDINGNWLDSRRLFPDLGVIAGKIFTLRWSPDGKRMVLIGGPEGTCQNDIWVVDVATEQAQRVVDHEQIPGTDSCDGIIDLPSWSPDGDMLIFSGAHTLWLYDFASGHIARWLPLGHMLKPVTRTHWTHEGLFYAAFSTEQSAPRIFQIVPDMNCLRDGLRTAVMIAQLPDCGRPQVITRSVRWALAGAVDDQKCPIEVHDSPAISPDGTYLAFVSAFYAADGSPCLSRAMIAPVARPNEVFSLDNVDNLNTYNPVWQPIEQ